MLENENVRKEMHLFDLWRKVWSWKLILIVSSVSTGILALIVSLLLPKIYAAEVTIIAPEAIAGGLAGGLIAQAAGIGLEEGVSSQTILALLNSSTATKAVIKEFNVVETFNLKDKTEASEYLDKVTTFKFDQIDGIISVTVECEYPELSAKMANFYVNHLNTLNETIKITPEKPFVKVIDWASVPSMPSKPRIKWNTAIGIFLGFFISLVTLYIRDSLQDYWS